MSSRIFVKRVVSIAAITATAVLFWVTPPVAVATYPKTTIALACVLVFVDRFYDEI
jgi:uncharacterized membrane protein